MATLVMDAPAETLEEQSKRVPEFDDTSGWLVFRYIPIALFSLKSSRATSTAGKTLLTPTPYAVKMAFLDVALRQRLTKNTAILVRWLRAANLRIGVPQFTCVTGTIQSIRQETRDVERKRDPELPPYRGTIAMREVVHFQGAIRLAFDLKTCPRKLIALLLRAAPGINYLGKRGSFIQYLGGSRQTRLDAGFTLPVDGATTEIAASGHRTVLDDFGEGASFEATFVAMSIASLWKRLFL
jgi:hypothetical protein